MEIRIDSLLSGARRAEGTVIVVDVFRAFTTAAVALSQRATKIIMVAEVNDALELRNRGVGGLCMGEVGGVRPEGFDLGNSPYELSQADVKGKTLIQSTRAGTVGVSAVHKAERLYACSFVVARATARAVSRNRPHLVTIVAMGANGMARTDEDELCALYVRNLLQGRMADHDALRALVLAGEKAQLFDDPALPHYHPEDRRIALQIDSIPFAISVRLEHDLPVARPEVLEQVDGTPLR